MKSILLFLALTASAYCQIDLSFGRNFKVNSGSGSIDEFVELPDGRFLVFGTILRVNGTPTYGPLFLDRTGTLLKDQPLSGFASSGLNSFESDFSGRIIAARFDGFNPATRVAKGSLIRLTAVGEIDPSFSTVRVERDVPNNIDNISGLILDFCVDETGGAAFVGEFHRVNGATVPHGFARVDAAGGFVETPITGFPDQVPNGVESLADGRFLVAFVNELGVLDADGGFRSLKAEIPGFKRVVRMTKGNGHVYALVNLSSDGVGGNRLIHISEKGEIDPSFDPEMPGSLTNVFVSDSGDLYCPNSHFRLYRLRAGETRFDDLTQFGKFDGNITSVGFSSDGSVVVSGKFDNFVGTPVGSMVKLRHMKPDAVGAFSSLNRLPTGREAIIGYIVPGTVSKTVMIRCSARSLAVHGVESDVGDPVMDIYRNGELIASNDDWYEDFDQKNMLLNAYRITGAFPLTVGFRESALLLHAEPGAYGIICRDKAGAEGHILVEVYEVPF